MYIRSIKLDSILERKSLFLLGPRQTGKSTFLKLQYPNALYIDLLKLSEYQQFLRQPNRLREIVTYELKVNHKSIVIIDEIQKIPTLLDEVHSLIEEFKNLRFILSGSSARKLKRGGNNLLGGRASFRHMHPLNFIEMNQDINLWLKSLTIGSLPFVLNSSNPIEDLKDYTGLYLKEEIEAEALVRSIEVFAHFIDKVAFSNAEQINYTKIANDLQIKPVTVREYYSILSDTLIGEQLPAFEKTSKRKAMTTAKFYFFDCGITNSLIGRKDIAKGTSEFGKMLEQAIFLELKKYIDDQNLDFKINYWRSTSQFEIDFLLYQNEQEIIGIEVKASANPSKSDYKGLLAFEDDHPLKRKIVVCMTDRPRLTEQGIEILPLEHFLKELWNGTLLRPT